MMITSKYPGRCRSCGTRIAVGDRVNWERGVKGVQCFCCSGELQERERARETSIDASRATACATEIPAPPGLSYLPYQRAGISYAMERSGTLVSDEMGLGKTIQAIGVINADPQVREVLVICPASLKLNWARECQRWLVRASSIEVRNGSRKASHTDELGAERVRVVIVNYDVLGKHSDLAAVPWDIVICDEAHMIKNPKTKRAKLTRALVEGAKRRLLLTGTPICNRPIELWPLLQLVAPERWDPAGRVRGTLVDAGQGAGFFRFAKRYCNAREQWVSRYKKVWDFSGSSNLPELQEELRASCMVRRLKADVLAELPPKRRQVIRLSADADAKRALKAEGTVSELADYAAMALEETGEAPAFAELSAVRHATSLAKAPLAAAAIAAALEEGDQKVVVFAHHKDVIDVLERELSRFGAAKIVGDTAHADRQAAVDRFQTDATCRVIIGSIGAMGVGLTLTAASWVVFVEMDWVPGNMSQAEDRCHRIGQTNSVLVQHLVLEGSIDDCFVEALVGKQAVIETALDKQAKLDPAPEPARTERQRKIDAEAATMTHEHCAAVHGALRLLAGWCDGATSEDGAGFSKLDTRIGHELAACERLSPRQAAFARQLVKKYRRQVGRKLLTECGLG